MWVNVQQVTSSKFARHVIQHSRMETDGLINRQAQFTLAG
uniref:Uncharacterized protein n=1 Tax=Klebsiella pneumoniae TaxID=573 RepID=A0A6H0AAR5_KLEPN|nr:hypothetical protein [Klebsiella pneumoniae]